MSLRALSICCSFLLIVAAAGCPVGSPPCHVSISSLSALQPDLTLQAEGSFEQGDPILVLNGSSKPLEIRPEASTSVSTRSFDLHKAGVPSGTYTTSWKAACPAGEAGTVEGPTAEIRVP
jgi:hypothetical protein